MPSKVGIMTAAALIWKSLQAWCRHSRLKRCQVTLKYSKSHFLLTLQTACLAAPQPALLLPSSGTIHCLLPRNIRVLSMSKREQMSKPGRMGKGRVHTAVCKAIHLFLFGGKNSIGLRGIVEIDSQYTFELWII